MVISKKVMCLCLCLFCCHGVYAVAGVTPASYDFDFEPNLEEDIYFNFIFDDDSVAEISVTGYLAEYFEVDKTGISGSETVLVHFKLPQEIEKPGVHKIFIGAKQVPKGGGVGIVANVLGVIKIRVPYPGKYAELSFGAENANAGETIEFELVVSNRGKQSIIVSPIINVFDSYNKIGGLDFDEEEILKGKSKTFVKKMGTEECGAGTYNATAVVDYGGKNLAVADLEFKLGELKIEIVNTSNYFAKGEINRFKIEVESFWNNPIENLFSEVKIKNHDIFFLTPSVDVKPWGKEELTGFFDASVIENDTFDAEIILNYEGIKTSKIVSLSFRETENYTVYIVAGILILIIVLIIVIVLTRRKNGKKKK